MLMYPNRLQSWFVFGQSGVPQLLDLQIYLFTSIFWYPKKCKRQTLAHENYPINERGYPWLLCSQTSLVMLNVGYLKLDVSGNISDFIQLFVTLLCLIFYSMSTLSAIWQLSAIRYLYSHPFNITQRQLSLSVWDITISSSSSIDISARHCDILCPLWYSTLMCYHVVCIKSMIQYCVHKTPSILQISLHLWY